MAFLEVADKAADLAFKGGSLTASGTGAASIAAKYMGYTTDEWTVIAAVGGLLIGVVGLAVRTAIDLYFKIQENRLKLRLLEASDRRDTTDEYL